MSTHGPTGWRMVSSRPLPLGATAKRPSIRTLLGEPAEELGRVGDLGLGLGHRLAHLRGHQQGQLVGPVVEGLERPAEDLAPLPRPGGQPLSLGGHGRVEGGHPVGRVASATSRSASPVEGSSTNRPRRPARAVAADEQPRRDRADDRLLEVAMLMPSASCGAATRAPLA